MKKTLKASLGGITFIIEEDAYILLDNYINTLKSRLSNEKESNDIISDLEERMSELFSDKKGNLEVITIDIVKEVIGILGSPEEIITDSSNSDHVNYKGRSQKRLYRNPDHSYIAGVCSGLSEYFSTDPLVIRIILIALIFAKGLGLILYLILWISVPKAVTPKQKLEMKGEAVTFSNIEKTIREDHKQESNRVRSSNFIENIVNSIGRIAYWFIKIIFVFIKIIAIAIAVVLIAAMLIALFAVINVVFFGGMLFNGALSTIGGFSLGEIITSMFEFSTGLWLTIPIFLVITIPLLTILYLGIRVLFRFKARDRILGLSAAALWVISILILASSIYYQAKSFTIRKKVTETVALSPRFSKESTLYIKATTFPEDSSYEDSDILKFDNLTLHKIDNKIVILGKPVLTIIKCQNEKPEIIFIRKARGASKLVAEQNAKNIKYNYALKDSILTLDPFFSLSSGDKWKQQELSITLRIPENYKIYIDSTAEEILNHIQPYSDYWPDEMVNKKWVMKEKILKELEN